MQSVNFIISMGLFVLCIFCALFWLLASVYFFNSGIPLLDHNLFDSVAWPVITIVIGYGLGWSFVLCSRSYRKPK
jgi:hypothetical protein